MRLAAVRFPYQLSHLVFKLRAGQMSCQQFPYRRLKMLFQLFIHLVPNNHQAAAQFAFLTRSSPAARTAFSAAIVAVSSISSRMVSLKVSMVLVTLLLAASWAAFTAVCVAF